MEQIKSVPVAYSVASLLLQRKGEMLLTCPFTQEPVWRLPSCECTDELPRPALASLAEKEFGLYLELERFDLVHTSFQLERGVVRALIFFSVRVWEGFPILPKEGTGHARWLGMERVSEVLPLNITLALRAFDEGLLYSEVLLEPVKKAVLRLVE